MSVNIKLMETLHRIEHKLDLLLKGTAQHAKLGDTQNKCPVCKQQVEYQIDIENGVAFRRCGCSTGKTPIDLKRFAPPIKQTPENKNGYEDSSEEDGNDPISGRGTRRR